jgi:hypothetical protein
MAVTLIRKAKGTGILRESSKNTNARPWYLRDEPLEYFDEEDQFRHKSYVQILMEIVKEVSPPFTLGIFGSWGVGKTSIVNVFRKTISQDKAFSSTTAVVCIDIWKYEKDALRRQFLLEVESQLKEAKTLPEDYNVEAQLYTTKTTEGQTEPRFSWRRCKEILPLLIEVSLIVAAVLFLIPLLLIDQIPQIVVGALVIPLLLYFVPRLSRIIVVQQKYSITEPALYSSEQFEKAFGDIVGKTKCQKMVIIIDNLDRCSRDRVVEVLGVVKTYLEPKGKNKCIFIIPCDDSAIKEQVKAAYDVLATDDEKTDPEGYADEYLRKFFNASIRITPFMEKEIEPYIERLLVKIRLTENIDNEAIKQLAQMIGFVFRKNPRRIKQFLNNLSSKYRLVKERESGDSPMINPHISNNILFFTKMSIIETKFPEMFQKFVEDDNLYEEVLDSLYTPKASNASKFDEELWHFLNFTKNVKAENPKAFFHLKQNPHEAKIPNYSQFLDMLRNGDRARVTKLFEVGDEESNTARLDEIITQIRDTARRRYYDRTLFVIKVACAVLPDLTTERQRKIARHVVGTITAYSEIRGKLFSLLPAEVFALLPFAEPTEAIMVQEEYVKLYSQGLAAVTDDGLNLQIEIARSIVNSLDKLSSSQRREVRDATAKFQDIDPDLLLVMSSNATAIVSLIDPSLVERVVQKIKEDDIVVFIKSDDSSQEHAPLIEFVIRCQDHADKKTATQWVERLLAILESDFAKENPQLEIYIHKCVNDTMKMLKKAGSDAIDKIANFLNQCYPQSDENRRLDIVLTLQEIYSHCSAQQEPIKQLVLDMFVMEEPLSNVGQFIDKHFNKDFKNLPYHEEVFDRLSKRVVSQGDDAAKRQGITDFLNAGGSRKRDLLANLLTVIIRRPEVSVTVPLVKEFSMEIPKSNQGKALAAPILSETTQPSRGSISVSERKELLDLAIYMKDWHTRDFQTDFDNVLGELLISDDNSSRQLGLDVLDKSHKESAISHDRRIEILHVLAASLTERKPQPDDSIMQQLTLIMDDKSKILDAELTFGIIEYLRQLIRLQVPANHRQQAFSLLSSFSDLSRDVLESLIPELVGHAKSERDTSMKAVIEKCMLALRRGNSALDRDLWEDAYGYHQLLLASQDESEKQRGKQLLQEMRQITLSAKKESGIGAGNGEQ